MRRVIIHSFLAVVVAAAVLLGGLATPIGRGIVVNMIERAASTDGLTVTIEGATGWPPFWLGAEKITVADDDGPFAEIDALEIDIRVAELLSGTIAAADIAAQRVVIERAPELESGGGGGGGGGALLPFVAERFALAELVLGEALVGRRAVVAVDGSASNSADGDFRAEIAAKRIDGVAGTLSARVSRASVNAPFAADIEISEAADGILVGLIGRQSGPAYKLAASAVPDGDAIRGSVTLASDKAAQFNGRFALTPDGTGRRVQVTASGDLAELVPAELAGLLSGAVDLGLDADWTIADGTNLPEIAIRQGQFTTATVDAVLSGRLSQDVADLSLRLDIVDPSGGKIALPLPRVPSEVARISLRGTVAPSNGTVRGELVGDIAGLDVGGVSVPATGLSLAVESERGGSLFTAELPFALRLEADAIRTPNGTIEANETEPLLLTANGTMATESGTAEVDIALRAAGGRLQFDGDLSTQEVTGNATAAFEDVGPLASLASRSMAGGLNATASGTFFGAGGADLQVTATLTDFDTDEEFAGRLLGGQSNLTGKLVLNSDGSVVLSNLAFTGETIEATADATISGDSIDASASGAIADLSSLAENTQGSAAFTADISGALLRPEVEAALRVDEGQLLGYPIRDGVAQLSGRGSADDWTATATLDGSFADKPLAGKVDVVAAAVDGGFSFPDIDLTIDENRITGMLERAGDGLLSGTLDVAAPDLATLAALAFTEVSGAAEARLTFAPVDDRQTISVALNGTGISYRSIAAESLAGEVRISDALGTPRIDGSARVTTAQIGSTRLDSLSATASADGDATAFELSAKGPNIDLTGAGDLSSDAGINVLRIDTVSGSAYRVPVQLQSPVVVRFADATAGLPTIRIAVGGGSVVVDGTLTPELNLTLAAERVPASVANGFAPDLGADGSVNGRVTVTGTPSAPQIEWQAEWSGLQTAATRKAKLPPLQLSASGSASLRETTIDGVVTGAAGLSLTVKGSAPFAGEGLAISVGGQAPLAFLALETTREVRLAGNAQLDIQVSGSAKAPKFGGSVDLADATVIDGETGFGVAGASGRIALDGSRVSTERITGTISQGGQVTLSGSVQMTAGMPGDLTINVANGRYNDGQVVDTDFNANLSVKGPLTGAATMSGTIALGRTEIQLPDRVTVAAGAIPVTHVNAPPGFVAPLSEEVERAARRSAGGNLRLDVEVTNSGGIFVRGFGVDAEFGGSLRITNTISDMRAVGAFTMRRGRIEVIGRRFDLVSGTLTFAGDLIPVVDFAATASTTGAAITVTVAGPADQPTISFTSNPDLPEEEILSRLLFDRSVSTLSVIQVAQLLDAAAQFSGGGGQGFFARIRDAIGVDDLDIRQNASGGTTVGVGKRINENVSVGVGAGSDGEQVTIDLDITPNLKARGSVGAGGSGESGSFGLTYEREY